MRKVRDRGIPDILQFRRMLRDKGLKATPQRLAVHEAMTALGHAGADEVAARIAEQGEVRVSPASVYNILSQLADLKIYSRRLSSNNKMYFDINNFRHMHLYDKENHRFRDIFDDELAELVQAHLKRRKFRGFTVEDIDIQLIARPTRKSKSV